MVRPIRFARPEDRGKDRPVVIVQYCNPIVDRNLADPFILRSGGDYYLFATGKAPDGRFLPIYRSRDLADWDFVSGAVERGRPGAWNRRNFWAPEVLEHEGRFCLYYTASADGTPENTGNRVGLAVSDRAEGPYEDVGVVVPDASLDGSPFRDSDGRLYMYYTIEHGSSAGLVAGRIYVDEMVSPKGVRGKPKLLVSSYEWQEGPCVVMRGGTYLLSFSTGNWRDSSYTVRWALGDSPTGPFEEQPGALLESTEAVKGPGHHNVFADDSRNDWIVYHGWDPEFKARYPRMDLLMIRPDRMWTPGPTSEPQEVGPDFWESAEKR
jgi:beta-xylosidase